MGLGKTVMMISVVMANPGRGGLATDPAVSGSSNTLEAPRSQLGNLSQVMEMRKKQSGLRKGGGTLIVCPMTLLGQWKVFVIFISTVSALLRSLSRNMLHILSGLSSFVAFIALETNLGAV